MDIEKLISEMTLEEKAGLCSGADSWHLKAVERLDLPAVMVSDGPHGLRKQDEAGDHLGINDSIPAVCFPTAAGTASSFDRELIRRIGNAIGEEAQAENVAVVLGPAANIKRSPLCGRNFEYFSEDPLLSSEMAAAYIQGVQTHHVGTSLKHFAANNQENRRMTASSEVDERTLREIYLASFEGAVKKAQPWTVMCSYNRINGVFASENPRTLTDILRGEWGFEGYVMSDWGAVNDRVAGLRAGLELEMPASGGDNDRLIVEAVRSSALDEAVLDEAVRRILTITKRYLENREPGAVFDRPAHDALARELARECMVLLKNENGLLPLRKEQRVAFIGQFAAAPRFQGGGSSHINASHVTSALEAAKDFGVSYAQGYVSDKDRTDEALLAEAVRAAKEAEVAVVFAGLPDAFESEGYDRTHLHMPDCQNRLISEICAVQKNVVVVLHNGSPVDMPWLDKVGAVLECYLGGQAVGGAAVDLLFGLANPCAKLAETFPKRLEDTPAYLNFPGDGDTVEYREGVYVGYRWYDARKMDVLFPFGYGLSYTTFDYSSLSLDKTSLRDGDTLHVSCKVKNTGSVAGKEIVQLYVRDRTGTVTRPEKELRDFLKVSLEPGEEKTVEMTLDRRAFAYYNVDLADWHVGSGEFDILIGASSRDIRLEGTVTMQGNPLPLRVTANTTCGALMRDPRTAAVLNEMVSQTMRNMGGGDDPDTQRMMSQMLENLPLRSLRSFSDGAVDNAAVETLVKKLSDALRG